MPVTRESIIQHLYSTSASAQPDTSLELGEIAINAADEALFIKNTSGTVKKLSATTDLATNLVTLSTTQTVTGDKIFSGNITFNNGIVFEGATVDNKDTTLTVQDPTSNRTITLPDASGTVAIISGSDTQIMFNDGGSALGGDAGLTYNKTTDSLTISGDLAVNGGDITTSSSTLNIAAGTTTVNIATGSGTAQSLTMGSEVSGSTFKLFGSGNKFSGTYSAVKSYHSLYFSTDVHFFGLFGATDFMGYGCMGTTVIGDWDGGANGTTITVDDSASGITFSALSINFGAPGGSTFSGPIQSTRLARFTSAAFETKTASWSVTDSDDGKIFISNPASGKATLTCTINGLSTGVHFKILVKSGTLAFSSSGTLTNENFGSTSTTSVTVYCTGSSSYHVTKSA